MACNLSPLFTQASIGLEAALQAFLPNCTFVLFQREEV